MSAYDKDFSDAIYGIEADGRYVTESRLKKMLTWRPIDWGTIKQRNIPTKCFQLCQHSSYNRFCKFKGHGWVGIRYQIDPDEDYNEIILHIRFKETDACNRKHLESLV
jgi:hypothetical protein